MNNQIFNVPAPRDPNQERRTKDRVSIKAPIKIHFSLPFGGEILDMSSEGISFKFHPLGSSRLNVGGTLQFQLDMGPRIVSLEGCIHRLDEKFGHFVIGIKYDRNEIALFGFNETSSASNTSDISDPDPEDSSEE